MPGPRRLIRASAFASALRCSASCSRRRSAAAPGQRFRHQRGPTGEPLYHGWAKTPVQPCIPGGGASVDVVQV